MKILFITSYPIEYWTSANIRNKGLIGGLLKEGHEVSTLSPYPSNKAYFSGELSDLTLKRRYWIGAETKINVNEDKAEERKPGKIKLFLSRLYSVVAIYDSRSWLVRQINNHSVEENFDVIISSSDPKSAHLLAERLIKKRPSVCKRWIQYWGDPFVGDISINYALKTIFIKKEERRLIKKCNKAVFVSPFTVEEVKNRLPNLCDKITFLPIPYIETNRDNLTQFTNGNLISYLGNYTVSRRDIRPLVEVINDLSIPAAIIGDSDIEIKSNDHLIVRERLKGKELQDIINQTRVFVCVCNKHGSQIPGKIYHYVDSGKPILIILDGEYMDRMRMFFDSFKRFYICRNEKDDIKNTILTIISEDKTFGIPKSLMPDFIARQFLTI